ncbi:hypothetical protein [Halolamina sp. C58]|uniref:hypothetical protein n=1 Tax=Halolamina sp. C58 TaxID=3421640 RepID=UPI003EB78ED1
MTVFKGGEAIKAFLEEFDSWLSEPVTVYLLRGSAMTAAKPARIDVSEVSLVTRVSIQVKGRVR